LRAKRGIQSVTKAAAPARMWSQRAMRYSVMGKLLGSEAFTVRIRQEARIRGSS
jgi:hypothetical protein